MIAKTFEVGDLVWAKMKSYPPWPGKVIAPPNDKGKKGQQYVYFFGTENHSWIKDENIMPHSDEQLKNICKRKFQGYFEAIEEIKQESSTKGKSPAKLPNEDNKKSPAADKPAKVPTPKVKNKPTKENVLKSDQTSNKIIKQPSLSTEESPLKTDPVSPNKISKKRKLSTEESQLKTDPVSPNKISKKRKLSTEENTAKPDHSPSKVSKKPKLSVEETVLDSDPISIATNKVSKNHKLSNEEQNPLDPNQPVTRDFSDLIKNVLECLTLDEAEKRKLAMEEAARKKLLEAENKENNQLEGVKENAAATLPGAVLPGQTLPVTTSLSAIPKKDRLVGFLGLGNIGRRLVLNLMRAGFKVMVWNRTIAKCDELLMLGAKKGETVAEVVRNCETTFCCVADADAVRTIVLSDGGVLTGFEGLEPGTRTFVEMSSIDTVTLKDMSEEIITAGMHFCEASVMGNMPSANEGKMLILGSGDKDVFESCRLYFMAMGGCGYFLSEELGHCAGITALTNTYMGVMYAAMAEILALAKRSGLAAGDLLEIFELRGILSPLMQEKGKAIMDKNYLHDTQVHIQEKDMTMAIQLSDQVDQPTPIASIGASIYTRAKMMGMSKYDCTGTYLCYHR